MRKLPATNRLYENLFPENNEKINWFKPKSEWLKDFNICLCIKNITPDKIIKTLNLNMKENKEYSEYLFNSVKLLQEQRRKRSIEVRQIQKQDKKTELKNLIKLKNTTHKKWTWKHISDLMNISVRHLRRLRDEIELENQNQYLINKIEILKIRINKYIETKRQIKEIGYHNINKKELGNINHINKLLKQYEIDPEKFYNILICNISFIIQKSSSYKSGNLDSCIDSFQTELNLFGYDENGNIYDCYLKFVKIIKKLTDERKIYQLIDEYKI